MAQTETDITHLRVELNNARNQISARHAAGLPRREEGRDVGGSGTAGSGRGARAAFRLPGADAGRARFRSRQVEEARVAENDKWIAFYDAQYVLEKARWSVLRLTGDLVPTIEGMP